MRPFKTFYAQEIEMWLRANPGRVVTVYQICDLFGTSLHENCDCPNAAEDFKTTGLFPMNRYWFGPADFPLHQDLTASDQETSSTALRGTRLSSDQGTEQSTFVKATDISPTPLLGDEQRKKKCTLRFSRNNNK